MVTISLALMGMRQLQALDLYQAHMTAEDITASAAVLPAGAGAAAFAGSLTHLTLSNCSRNVEATAIALAPALAQATNLIELLLNDIYSKQRGAQ